MIENLTFDDMGRRIGLDPEQLPAFCARLFELQHQIWQLAIFPDMLPVLRQLATRHDLVVITSSQSQSVKANLDQAGLLSCFADILGGDLELSKAQRIERSCRKFAGAREATFMVGDAVSDIRQGKLAGVGTVAVTWGFQDRHLLEREHPDHIVDTPQALLSLDATTP